MIVKMEVKERPCDIMIISVTEHSKRMTTYLKDGIAIASRINNKGPLSLDENGKLHPEILKAYEKYGFYIFENVIDLSLIHI